MNKKRKLHFVTDLDRTIIHSKNPGYKCVEYMGDKEITYMTDESYNSLVYLMKNEEFLFIPCTMRNKAQVRRVMFLKDAELPVMICTNGAQIYLNDELDLEWDALMREKISTEIVDEIYEIIKSLQLEVVEIRKTEDFYLSLKFENDEYAKKAAIKLDDIFTAPQVVKQIGRKVFVIHEEIDKVHAVSYLIQKYGWENLVTAGDSDVDEKFSALGQCILPKHASFNVSQAKITQVAGILATDEIMVYLNSILDKKI